MFKMKEGQHSWGREDKGRVIGAGMGEPRTAELGNTQLYLQGCLGMGLMWATFAFENIHPGAVWKEKGLEGKAT